MEKKTAYNKKKILTKTKNNNQKTKTKKKLFAPNNKNLTEIIVTP